MSIYGLYGGWATTSTKIKKKTTLFKLLSPSKLESTLWMGLTKLTSNQRIL